MYDINPDFSISYQTLQAGRLFLKFYLQDELLCHLGHLRVSLSKSEKLVRDGHYNQVANHYSVENTVIVL